jgi:hypothetical protein
MASTTETLRLAEDTEATFVHGITGRDVAEETLQAGALVRDLRVGEHDPFLGAAETHFLASSDGGEHWYHYRTYGPVPTMDR